MLPQRVSIRPCHPAHLGKGQRNTGNGDVFVCTRNRLTPHSGDTMSTLGAWAHKLKVGQVITVNGGQWLVVAIDGAIATLTRGAEQTTWTIPEQLQ